MTRHLLVLIALAVALVATESSYAHPTGGMPVALVTAETENALLAIWLPDGRILRRVALPADPENVAPNVQGPVVVVSAKGHAVSILAFRTLKVMRILRGFLSPHLAAISPDGKWVYVTDDAAGTVTVIRLATRRIVRRIFVGLGAHHLPFTPDQRQPWIALGEDARTIVVLSTSVIARPRVIERFDPGFPAHGLAFSPDRTRVWTTVSNRSELTVFSARTRRALFRVPASQPPQHLVFGEITHDAYVTSGYGSRLEQVTGRVHVLRTVPLPYGSFNVATAGNLIVTSSLLSGNITEVTDLEGRQLLTKTVAPAARDVAISVW